MPNYPFSVPSGVTLSPQISGNSSLGTASNPFSSIYVNSISGTANPGQQLIYSSVVSGSSFSISGLTTGVQYEMKFALEQIGSAGYLMARVNNDSSAIYNVCVARMNAGVIGVDDVLNTANPYFTSTVAPNSNGSMHRGHMLFSSDLSNSNYTQIGGQSSSSNANNGKPAVNDFSIVYVNGTPMSGLTILPSAGTVKGLVQVYKLGNLS